MEDGDRRELDRLADAIEKLNDTVATVVSLVQRHEILAEELVQPTREMIAEWRATRKAGRWIIAAASAITTLLGAIAALLFSR